MQKRPLILPLAVCLAALAQIGPPSAGVTGGGGTRIVEIQGIPHAWVARAALGESVEAAASSSAELCWTAAGVLHIKDKLTGKAAAYAVPEGDARFAFDAQGTLAAVWFLTTGEVYTSAAGWTAIYTSPEADTPLDLIVAKARALVLLHRADDRLHRTRIDAITGSVQAESTLEDRGGPALLDSGGNPVFAVASGLSNVQTIRRAEQGWMLVTTAHGLWLWQAGKQPQGVPVASGSTPTLQLWTANGSQDVGSTVVLPPTPIGSTTQAEYILANTGTRDVYLTTLHLTTAAPFKLVGAPHPPWRVGAGLLQGFFINFSPTAVGAATPSSLTVNYCNSGDFDTANNACPATAVQTRDTAITGTGLAAPASGPWLTGISPESNMAGAPGFTMFVNGGGYTVGSTVLWNGTPLATFFSSSVQLSAAVPASLLTAPADVSVTVSNPPGGSANVTKAWAFHVYSSVTPSIALFDQNDAPLTASQLSSNMTVRVRVKLDQSTGSSLSGVVELGFQPGPATVATDQAIALGSAGSDQQVGGLQQFTVSAGATTAQFGTKDYVTLTTGTTAGTLTLDVALQNALPATPEKYIISPAPPVILSAAKVSTSGSVVVTVQGYDNTRSISSVAFTFHTASGAVVAPGAMSVDVSKGFADYFQANPQIGGSFVLTATFPATGEIPQIASVTTSLTSNSGTTSANQ